MQGRLGGQVRVTLASGKEIVHRLAARADVVLQGFGGGTALSPMPGISITIAPTRAKTRPPT